MLSGAGFGDDAGFAHAHGKQDLAKHIVDFVCAGVVQLVAFQIDFRAASVFGEAFGKIEGARTTDIMGEVGFHLALIVRIGLRLGIGFFERQDEWHQRFSDETTTKLAEMASFVRPGSK